MKKIHIVIPKVKDKKLNKILKNNKIKKFVVNKNNKNNNYEIIATELQAEKIITLITKKLKIHKGKSSKEGYIAVTSVDIVAPYMYDKGSAVELEELLMSDVKDFINLDRNYILFIICAAILASIAFILDNLYILIGAMIIGPFMTPIMATSYGIMKKNKNIIFKGFRNEIVGILLIVLTTYLMSFFSNSSLSFEIGLVSNNLFLSFVLSAIIGIVASTSFLTGKFEAQTGVAISISLIPPLANAVILFSAGEFSASIISLFAFLINVFGLHFSSFFTFLIIYLYKERLGKK